LILNPWDREILRYGEFILHPEYAYALQKQGLSSDLPVNIEPVKPAKARS
jgi:hypothetical protein